jgi:hypothetical protein
MFDVKMLFRAVNQSGLGVDHPSPSTTDIKNEWSYFLYVRPFAYNGANKATGVKSNPIKGLDRP